MNKYGVGVPVDGLVEGHLLGVAQYVLIVEPAPELTLELLALALLLVPVDRRTRWLWNENSTHHTLLRR